MQASTVINTSIDQAGSTQSRISCGTTCSAVDKTIAPTANTQGLRRKLEPAELSEGISVFVLARRYESRRLGEHISQRKATAHLPPLSDKWRIRKYGITDVVVLDEGAEPPTVF